MEADPEAFNPSFKPQIFTNRDDSQLDLDLFHER